LDLWLVGPDHCPKGALGAEFAASRERKAMTIEEAIAELFRRKINCGCETFVDAGIRLWIADVMNDRRAETQLPFGRLAESGQWLVDAARRLCPEAFIAIR
jgi:hypothetical protein